MTPANFWRVTPRKFNALCKVHVELNTSSKGKKDKNPSGGVGKPDTYVDNVPGL